MRKALLPALVCLQLSCAGLGGSASPAWSDDSRSDLAAQGTTIDANRSSRPPQALEAPAHEPLTAPPPAPPAGGEARPEDDAPLPPSAPVVRLIELGAEPRTLLRYRLAGPSTEDLTMTTDTLMSTGLASGTMGPEMATPGMRMIMSVTGAPAGKGTVTSSARVTDADAIAVPGVMPVLVERTRAELRKLVGMTVDSHLTTRGAVIKVETTLPPDAPASARSTVEGLQSGLGGSAVLPAEAVGVGARWESESDLKQNGISIHQHSRYFIRELVGTRVALDIELELSASAQEIKVPGSAMTVQLDGMHGSGSGTQELDLASLVPRRQHLAMDSDLSMRVPMGTRSLAMSTRMKVTIDVHAGR
jgi:hypothetical protein